MNHTNKKKEVTNLVDIYIVREGGYEHVEQPDFSVFSTGDTYIVDAGDRIWIWLGVKTTVDEKFAGAFVGDLLDKERRGAPDVETVEQGNEPIEFRKAVGGMRIVDADLAKSILKKVEKETHPVVLYRISIGLQGDATNCQVKNGMSANATTISKHTTSCTGKQANMQIGRLLCFSTVHFMMWTVF